MILFLLWPLCVVCLCVVSRSIDALQRLYQSYKYSIMSHLIEGYEEKELRPVACVEDSFSLGVSLEPKGRREGCRSESCASVLVETQVEAFDCKAIIPSERVLLRTVAYFLPSESGNKQRSSEANRWSINQIRAHLHMGSQVRVLDQ